MAQAALRHAPAVHTLLHAAGTGLQCPATCHRGGSPLPLQSALCSLPLQDLDDMDTYDSTVINCLQDFNSEIKNTECKRLVKKYIALASEDIRFDVPLAEACADDRQKFCAALAPVRLTDSLCLEGDLCMR